MVQVDCLGNKARIGIGRIKKTARKIPLIYVLNARWKAIHTKRLYWSTYSYYKTFASKRQILYQQSRITKKIVILIAERELKLRLVPPGKLRIFYAGDDENQDTSGFLQSLEKFGSVYHFTQSDCKYGLNLNDRLGNGNRLLELVKKASVGGHIHLVLGQMNGKTIPWQVLNEIRNMGIITVNICMDDRHAFRGSFENGEWTGTCGLIPGLDLALTTTPEATLWYEVEQLPAIFWPEASNSDIFHPMDIPKKHDVCFVGANYGIRAKIIRALKKRRIKVECYGDGWLNGRIATKNVPALFASSKIILGVGTIGHCTDFYSLKLRDFDAPMSGSLYLTHANPDLHTLFEIGKEIVCYRSPKECADKCEYYLSHDHDRETIAKAGLARSLREHTWETRFDLLFKTLGLLENGMTNDRQGA